MRMTVGPLPPAVYWRRRAVVLGSALLVVVLLAYSCGGSSGGDSAAKTDGAKASTSPSVSAPGDQPDSTHAPGAGATTVPTPTAGAVGEGTDAPVATTGPTAGTDSNLCTDDELLITPVPAARQLPRGATLQITLKIKNRSKRTCDRDVGADLQELYIMEQGGAQKVWSSDDCGGARGNNVEEFTPGFERAYTVNWNGRASTRCNDQPIPEAGQYQIFGRLGTKRSDPVTITLT